MYEKDELTSLASFSTIMRVLKKDPNFNKYCTQHRVKKGTKVVLDKNRKDCYLLEAGFVKYNYIGQSGPGLFFVIPQGRFVSLPFFKDQFIVHGELTALNDLIWWKIDVEYLRKLLLLEDPRNFIVLDYAIQLGYYLYIMTKKYYLSAEHRIYFSLQRCSEVGIRIAENQIELPSFLTYDLLAEFSGTSKGYTSTVLGELRDKGILLSSKKPWIITDVAWLDGILEVEGLARS
ncbi:Crp/Fnr family transcriptional regulator [Listeria rustica]|uniref:Crp/Fnr family transcriptional regulator n=1 Tax=Listeria rustica TaxID=2713503 RepID=A0A7W1T967_9LIST|nr:Crp/Fnr family transcriptional regulator [Listeria rustica]MBA3927681.1 Crp/Fnr family transcriptional regulator [Listeria rustica]